jgi:hypothetical protein
MSDLVSNISSLAIESLPSAGAAVGSMIAPGLGTELGAVAGQLAAGALSSDASPNGSGLFQGEGATNATNQSTTTFIGEQVQSESVVSTNQEDTSTAALTSLRKFFARPLAIKRGRFQPSERVIPLWPRQYFTSPQVSEKLRSYSGARFTLCLKFVTNCTPFSNYAGVISYLPTDTYATNNHPDNTFFPSTNVTSFANDLDTLVASFHAPHVVHNISETNETTFKVQWHYPLRFLDTGTLLGVSSSNYNAYDMMGRFWICDIAGILSASSVLVDGDYTVYMWLEDLDLFYPTSFDVIHNRISPPVSFVNRPLLSDPEVPEANGPEHHSHFPKTQIVARNDYIDDIAHPPGIARPQALTETQVEVSGGTDDDMIPYFQTPSLCAHHEFTVGQMSAGRLWVRPSTGNIAKSDLILSVLAPTKLAVSTDLYAFWRGSIVFDINFVMSKFHTGRIQFGFIPHAYISPTDLPASQIEINEELWQNIDSTVIDLRETQSLSIVCPYKNTTFMAHRVDVSGTLIWRTVNPVQAQEGASSAISCYIQCRAGPDFQVARFSPLFEAYEWFDAPVTAETIPEANGLDPTDFRSEIIPDVVNDGPVTFSQAMAAPSTQVNNICVTLPETNAGAVQTMYIGGDNDILACGVSLPRTDQIATVPLSPVQLSHHQKIRNLFYGIRSDAYLKKTGTLSPPARFGTVQSTNVANDNAVYPFLSNVTYDGLGHILDVPASGPKTTPFGETNAFISSFPGCRLFLPWLVPTLAHLGTPRTPTRASVTSRHLPLPSPRL